MTLRIELVLLNLFCCFSQSYLIWEKEIPPIANILLALVYFCPEPPQLPQVLVPRPLQEEQFTIRGSLSLLKPSFILFD